MSLVEIYERETRIRTIAQIHIINIEDVCNLSFATMSYLDTVLQLLWRKMFAFQKCTLLRDYSDTKTFVQTLPKCRTFVEVFVIGNMFK